MAAAGLQVLGLGASTPIGRTVWASVAAARAGLCGFSHHPYLVDIVGAPMSVARIPWIDESVEGALRFCELLFPAIDEALNPAWPRLAASGTRLGLALAVPPVRPGRPTDLAQVVSAEIVERYGGIFGRTLLFETGHAGGYWGLDAAMRGISHGSIDACLVAGVDSYIAPDTLDWVEACDQLHGAGASNNAWGFIPGEAAAAVLVGTNAVAESTSAEPYGELVGVGLGRETKLIKTDAVCIGAGLTDAFRAALAALAPGERIDNVYCDLNGETYRADEYGFTSLRTKERFRAPTEFVAPADCWGDIGAAGAPLHVAMSVIAHRKRYGKGPLSLVWGSSESGERGAAVVRANGGVEH